MEKILCKVCGSDKVEIVDDTSIWEYKNKTIEIDNHKISRCNDCMNEITDEETWNSVVEKLKKFRKDVDEGKVN